MVIKANLLQKNFLLSMTRLALAIVKTKTILASDDLKKIVDSRKMLYAAAEKYKEESAKAPFDAPHTVAKAKGVTMLVQADMLCKDCSDGVRLFLEVIK
jgi:hypothetical protein